MEFETLSVGDISLRAGLVRVDRPWASVLLLHGRTEFIEKYREVIDRLTEAGISVGTFDWRGQGLSGPEADPAYVNEDGSKRGHITDFKDYDADFQGALEWFNTHFPASPKSPRILVAHSMGGMIGLRGLIKHQAQFDGAVFSAPMWGLPRSNALRFCLAIVEVFKSVLGSPSDYVPSRGPYRRALEPFKGNPLTHDPVRFERYHDAIALDQRLGTGGPSMAWLRAALDAIKELPEMVQAAPPNCPIRILSCLGDPVVDIPQHKRIASLLPNAHVEEIPDGLHEPLMERDAIFERSIDTIRTLASTLRS